MTNDRYIKVEGSDNLYRDIKSGAILNLDQDAYNNAVDSLKKRKVQKQTISTLQKDVSELKSDMSTIKTLLLQLVGEKNDS
jgi:hypothetical protein